MATNFLRSASDWNLSARQRKAMTWLPPARAALGPGRGVALVAVYGTSWARLQPGELLGARMLPVTNSAFRLRRFRATFERCRGEHLGDGEHTSSSGCFPCRTSPRARPAARPTAASASGRPLEVLGQPPFAVAGDGRRNMKVCKARSLVRRTSSQNSARGRAGRARGRHLDALGAPDLGERLEYCTRLRGSTTSSSPSPSWSCSSPRLAKRSCSARPLFPSC